MSHRFFASMLVLFVATAAFAQAQQVPQGFNYQGIVRDANGNPIANQASIIRFSILDGSATGTAEYVETHNATTNTFGLVNLQVGQGTPVSGTFSAVSWANGNKWLKVEVDLLGNSTYLELGTSRMLSVPYAIVAGGTTQPSSVALNDLTDVNAGTPSANQVLKWNGSAWVADTDESSSFTLPYVTSFAVTDGSPAAFSITQTGTTANAGHFSLTDPRNFSPALSVTTSASGPALSASTTTTSHAGEFTINNLNNNMNAVYGFTNGTGHAGYFQINNIESDSAAVYATTDGTGYGVYSLSTASGQAYGIYASAEGDCILGQNGATVLCPIGIYGRSRSGAGVFGYNTRTGPGVQGFSQNGNAFEGWGPDATPGNDDLRFYVANTGKTYAQGSYYTPESFSSSNSSLSEMIPAGSDNMAEGDVIVINENGQFIQSFDTNQTTVMGIYSQKGGFVGGNTIDANGNPTSVNNIPMAVAGFAMVNVSDENGAITFGDLLVTSSTSGHAMKAGDSPAPGTVIGKALESFSVAGNGTIKVLVTLQ